MQELVQRLDRHRVAVLVVLAAITALLAIPMITMAPTESASTEPGGPVFDARDAIDERFPAPVYAMGFIITDPDGDVLDAGSLRQLHAAARDLRADPELGPTLLETVDVATGTEVDGLVTVADLVDDAVPGGIDAAPDDLVEATATAVVDQFGADAAALGLSTRATRDGDRWTSPAVVVQVLGDNEVLDYGANAVNLGGGTAPEDYARDVLAVLGDASGMEVHGIAIDVNLTSQEQGQLAGPFIGLTVLAVLLIVGLTFRSYWVLAVVGVALGALMIWLKGITHLVGFDDDLVLSLIVPIAMISFGVDFAFHAVGRYREERLAGSPPRGAVVGGLTAVGAALLLALSSDMAAFLSNVTAGIESIVNFGIGAAIALAAAFLLLGVATPLAVSMVDDRLGRPPAGRRAGIVRGAGSVAAASMVMGAVLLMVFVAPAAGVGLYVVTVLATVVVPAWWRSRGVSTPDRTMRVSSGDRLAEPMGRWIAAVATRPVVVVVVAALLTAGATVLALQVPTRFDVEDYFSADSDFVVGLDLLDEHVGSRDGEPAQLYVEADLTDPAVEAHLRQAVADVRALDSEVLARNADGVVVEGGTVAVMEAVMSSPVARDAVATRTGVELVDADGDGIPDEPAQVRALLASAAIDGVSSDDGAVVVPPRVVATSVDLDGPASATVFELGLTNSRSQEAIGTARAELAPIIDDLRADLQAESPDALVELTGSSLVRDASLQATSRALAVSLPVAVVLCLLIAAAFLRSIRFAVAAILPILMTVAWLYAFMEVIGAALNIVTATIAAVSIGIGIDFAIHYIARFREELGRRGDARDAVRAAGEGTGTALVASAVSSAVGFGILAFAPMPLFATYGLLTAVMIVMALVATLGVLPSVLVLLSPARSGDDRVTRPATIETPEHARLG